MKRYPPALWHPSSISHDLREATIGLVIHWTAGREAGDVVTLDGPNVDVQLYFARDGSQYQFLDLDSEAWHGKRLANNYCVGFECEGSGEAWTDVQFKNIVKATAYVCSIYGIPPVHVDPSGSDLKTFHGIFGHRDLSIGGLRVDGNDHTDTVPAGIGWDRYLKAVRREMAPDHVADPGPDFSKLPKGGTLRLALGGRLYSGWEGAYPAMKWVIKNGIKDPKAAIAWNGNVWRGAKDTEGVVRNLWDRFLA